MDDEKQKGEEDKRKTEAPQMQREQEDNKE